MGQCADVFRCSLKMKRPKAVKMFRDELDRMYAEALEEEKSKSKPRL